MANQVKGKTQQSVNWSYTPAPKQSHLPPKSPFPSSIGPAFVDYNNQRNIVQQQQQQLPPRERELGYRQHHQRTSSESILIEEQPSWLEDLLNEPETPVRKGSHRRSASDSAAFLDIPIATSQFGNEHLYNANNVRSRRFFDSDFPVAENRLQHNSHHSKAKKPPIKNWDAPPIKSWDAPLASLKGGSRGKVLPGGSCQMQDIDGPVSSSHKREEMLEWSLKDTANVAASEGKVPSHAKTAELDLDSKRAKQQFAQRSRVRKLQYISELERNVSALEAEESEVSAEVTFLNQQRIILTLENQALKQRIAGLVQEKMIKDAEHEMLVKEAQRLKLLYHQQHLQQHQPSLQSNHLTQAPGSLDYDLQQLKFSKLSLGSRENSEPNSSGSHGSFVLPTDIVAMRKVHDGNDSETSLNGRDASSTNVSCMFTGANKNVDKKRMMAGSGLVPVDFMLQNS